MLTTNRSSDPATFLNAKRSRQQAAESRPESVCVASYCSVKLSNTNRANQLAGISLQPGRYSQKIAQASRMLAQRSVFLTRLKCMSYTSCVELTVTSMNAAQRQKSSAGTLGQAALCLHQQRKMQGRFLFACRKGTDDSNSCPKWSAHLSQVAAFGKGHRKCLLLNIFKSFKLLRAGAHQMDHSKHM